MPTLIQVNSNYTAEVEAKKSITVTKVGFPPNRFVIGDQAEYDSYNFSYYGTIVGITEKTVTIEEKMSLGTSKKHRLKLDTFCWRNYNFKLSKAQENNIEVSYSI